MADNSGFIVKMDDGVGYYQRYAPTSAMDDPLTTSEKIIIQQHKELYSLNAIINRLKKIIEENDTNYVHVIVKPEYINSFSDSTDHDCTGYIWQENDEYYWIKKALGSVTRFPKHMVKLV